MKWLCLSGLHFLKECHPFWSVSFCMLKIYLHLGIILPSVLTPSSGLSSISVERSSTFRNTNMNFWLPRWDHSLLCCFYTAFPYFIIDVLHCSYINILPVSCHTCLLKLQFFCPHWTQITFFTSKHLLLSRVCCK